MHNAEGAFETKTKLGTWGIVIITAVIVSTASVAGTWYYLQASNKKILVVATTTSLYDTGLLDEIEGRFEEKYLIDLRFISVGTGIAIRYAQCGDADMLLVHSPPQELKFLEENYGVNRKIIAYNFFQIVGSNDDSAQIEGLSVIDAMSKIVSAGRKSRAIWISRGDNSGTHSKEKALWTAAGLNWTLLRDETGWFKETGSGMGKTLITTNELEAYTLTDIGTFLAYSEGTSNSVPNLKILVSQEAELINVYSVIAANKTMNRNVNFEAATTFTKFLVSREGQQIIQNYGFSTYGQALFYPAVELLRGNVNLTTQMIRDYAYFNGSECPPKYRCDYPELYG